MQLATAETIEATYLGSLSLGRCDNAAVVRVADCRDLRLGIHEPQGVFGPGCKPIFGSCRKVVLFTVGKRCDQEQFDGECGVGGRLLCAHTVRVDLAVDLDKQVAPALLA